MVDREHPCARGLTPNCFKAYPAWAKQAFAYRLMHALFPGRITRRLPRVLWEPLIGEGAEIPPDVVLPPGTVVPPWFSWDLQWTPWFFLDFDWWVDPTDLFPPGWETGDPLPPGVEVDPEYVFPPGWTPDLPLPPGVDVDPGVTFPPGWTPDLPLPPGVTIDPIQVLPPGWNPGAGGPPPIMLRSNLPPEAVESGPAPPAYTQIWEPGPVHRNYPETGAPLVEGFAFKLTRGDGTLITEASGLLSYIDVWDKDWNWYEITAPTYNPTTKHWEFNLADPETVSETGYWVLYNCTDGLDTQYPYRYKYNDQQSEDDLIQMGTYEDTIPYWSVGDYYILPTPEEIIGGQCEQDPEVWLLYGAELGFLTSVSRNRVIKSSVDYKVRAVFFSDVHWLGDPNCVTATCEYSPNPIGLEITSSSGAVDGSLVCESGDMQIISGDSDWRFFSVGGVEESITATFNGGATWVWDEETYSYKRSKIRNIGKWTLSFLYE